MGYTPKLFIIAGPNGSGKTSIGEQLLKRKWLDGYPHINPDILARDMFGDWNSRETILEAAQFATQWRESCLNYREILAFETVFSSPDKVDYIERAKEAGYLIRLIFIATDHPSINASRIAQRVLEGGHDVPIPKIISRYSKSIANCVRVASIVDRLYVYDNSVDNEFPKLLFRANDGKIIKKYAKINDWAKNIYQAVR